MRNFLIKNIPLILLLLILPPLWGVICGFFLILNKKNNKLSIVFPVFVYALFLAYISPIYDVMHNITYVYYYIPSFDILIATNFAVVFLYYTSTIFNCECLNIYQLMYFFIMLFLLVSYYRNVGLSNNTIIVALGCVALVSLVSITFYTFAIALCCFWASQKNINRTTLFFMVVTCFFFHKSTLFLILPSIGLYLLVINKKRMMAIILLITMFAVIWFSFHSDYLLTLIMNTIDPSGYLAHKTSGYVGDGVWGTGNTMSASLSRQLISFIQYSIQIFAIYSVYKYHKLIKNKLLLSLFCVNEVILLASFSFYTLAERFSISGMIFSCLIILIIYSNSTIYLCGNNRINSKLRVKLFTLSIAFFYLLSLYEIYTTAYKTPLINKKYANSITNKVTYLPSFLLIDIKEYGFKNNVIAKYNE